MIAWIFPEPEVVTASSYDELERMLREQDEHTGDPDAAYDGSTGPQQRPLTVGERGLVCEVVRRIQADPDWKLEEVGRLQLVAHVLDTGFDTTGAFETDCELRDRLGYDHNVQVASLGWSADEYAATGEPDDPSAATPQKRELSARERDVLCRAVSLLTSGTGNRLVRGAEVCRLRLRTIARAVDPRG